MTVSPIDIYRRQIEKELQAGNATEHTHRPALKSLLESLAPGVTATNEPKRRVDCGAPDIAVTEKREHGPVTIGHVETKDVDKDLGESEKSDQMNRYLHALPNLVLTDYLEFRWYVNGEHRQSARLARVAKGGKLAPEKDGAEAVTDLLSAFLSRKAEPINDPKTLALRMARLTHFIRDMIVTAFDAKAASATLRDLHSAFEKALIPDLPIPQFADMFAQTLAYGLFAARVNHHGPLGSFKRLGAASEIPKTNPFLRQLFETITGTALDEEPFAGFVDDLAQLLADTDMESVLADFGTRTIRQDPVMHFYETFLAAYDPKMREMRGVYYTPEPVVSYLVRSVDYLLKTRFGCANGLADTATVEYEREDVEAASRRQKSGEVNSPLQKATSPRVLILDPACGTGTFLYTVIDHIRAEFMRQENAGMWSGYVRNHLLPRIFGFELLMAPYAVAHFKLGMQLAGHDLTPALREKWAYDFSGDERLGVFLTNTLEEAERRAETLFGPLRVITEEANAASDIKRNRPILAVIGNPPYSGHPANRSWEMKEGKRVPTFIGHLIQDYYSVDGKPLGEKNPKWLQDDYVKFIRWGQWRIERTGAGVLAFITNHGYLDGPTFRGMRRSLMSSFTEIYVLNLHGNSKKKEHAPDGTPDENVFDIQQGVTLGIFVKEPTKASPVKVYHADLWGLRGHKYQSLFGTEVGRTKWTELGPQAPDYLFIEQDKGARGEYERGRKITDAMPVSSLGIATARDDLTVHWSGAEMMSVARDFAALPVEEAREKYDLGEDVRDWKVSLAQEDLRNHGLRSSGITKILYRPFDNRFTYYTGKTRGFHCMPRREVMSHFLGGGNLGLSTTRSVEIVRGWEHVFCSRQIIQLHTVSLKEVNYLFPLYIYLPDVENPNQAKLNAEISVWPAGKNGRTPNFSATFIADLEKRLTLSFVSESKGDLKRTFGPEDVFNYIYAVFHSPTYRSRYAEFLKSDFPRVPLTSDREIFRSLCGLGVELVALHLLESPKLSKPIARYPVSGPNIVEKGFPKYFAPGELEPASVAAGLPRHGGVKPPLHAAVPQLKEGRVYINRGTGVPAVSVAATSPSPKTPVGTAALQSGQYFEGVPPEVWNFHIGGYQVCEKWLKDRRGRTLTYDDLEHYCKVVTALSETIRLMAEIDAAIPKWPIE
ncbi:MAG TPA: type ISP restriction/modification enzyme [Terriglobia bacterium]|nr:type ISP restriction/modification enzyme [Terriglobia bacterium]